jgi:hypothetical protein
VPRLRGFAISGGDDGIFSCRGGGRALSRCAIGEPSSALSDLTVRCGVPTLSSSSMISAFFLVMASRSDISIPAGRMSRSVVLVALVGENASKMVSMRVLLVLVGLRAPLVLSESNAVSLPKSSSSSSTEPVARTSVSDPSSVEVCSEGVMEIFDGRSGAWGRIGE